MLFVPLINGLSSVNVLCERRDHNDCQPVSKFLYFYEISTHVFFLK